MVKSYQKNFENPNSNQARISIMATNDYQFLTIWEISAPAESVFQLIESPVEYPRWWPEVWLAVKELDPGDANKIGSRFLLHTKGRLPYTLRWESQTIEKQYPHRLVLKATGDFDGQGIWTISHSESGTRVEYDWRLRAEKPLLKKLSFLMKPLFRWNHHWAMAKGLEGLCRELNCTGRRVEG